MQTPEEIHPLSAELSLFLPGQYFKVAERSQPLSPASYKIHRNPYFKQGEMVF